MAVVNGRFLGQRQTGVQRYAFEITNRLKGKVALIPPPARASGVAGHLWEQFTLPGLVGDNRLWSPCNTGPLSIRDQILTLHDCAFLDTPESFSRPFRLYYQWLIPRLVRKVKHITTVSVFSAERIWHHFKIPSSRISVIPCGSSSKFTPRADEEIRALKTRLGISGKYLLSLGSVEPRKNLGALLAAWKAIPSGKKSGARLVLVGEQNARVFSQVNREASNDVLWTGFLPDEDLPSLYSGAEAFLFPSLYEGFGLPVLEAMSCGTPVFASNRGAIPEVGGSAISYFNPSSEAEIRIVLGQILEGGLNRQEMIKQGISQASRFDWEASAASIFSLLSS